MLMQNLANSVFVGFMIYIADLACWEDNKNSFKTLISVEYTGVKVKLSPNFEMGVCNKTLEFLKMNLLGRFLCWKHLLVQYLRAIL
uniref:Uncharacterized protein n=1 Tax=Quercus lobata TaxID=97700 RepID=A0A7N2L242_QUELO